MPAEDEQTARYFSNQALFSDHYLAERMDAHPEWTEDIGDAFAQWQRLYQARRDILDGLNEAQTEEEFIRPALEMLGFAYIPQTGFTQAGRQLRPDYALFADEAAKTEAYRFLKDEGKFYPRALAICDAKYWGRPLDVKQEADPRDEFKNTNPSFQIVNYLVGTDVDWGILTNGRLWRLYYQKARSRASTYYEVDLGLILEREDREALRYFYHFFRQGALVKDPATDRNFLERIYEESVTYALQVQEELKSLIFEKIVPILAEGFVAWRRAELGITEETEASLRQIFTATLTLLYRLLFLLYAESRELLPVSDRLGYCRYSLTRLKGEAMARLGREEVFSTVSDDLWNDLAALFRIIDRGDPALNVPTYNGGLFDRRSPKNAFLEEHRIADAYLVQALDLLTRRDDPDTGERRFIDYRDLDVRHLGSIYEGLLEFYLRIAQEDLAAVKERGVEVYRPLAEVKESRGLGVIRKGGLYLENDKGQRKATGSYYTPDYIVKYIVANTLGPIMDEREAAFAEAMTEWETHWGKLARAEGKLQEYEGQPGRWQTYWTNRRDEHRLALQAVDGKALKALLDVKVCDPAMGSGHFLVEAVAYLTDRIIDILNLYPENPVLEKLAAIREQILANLEGQGIRVNRELLTDTNLLKRMVMKRCIYGVDLNPMAVELAKLSLWLDSFTVGAPLSFLDHHLKVGNSLIGIRDIMQYIAPGSQREQELRRAIANTIYIASLTDSTFTEVRTSQTLFEECGKLLKPTKERLNVELATNFVDLGGIARAAQLAYSDIDSRSAADPESLRKFTLAQQVAESKQFFHWELEFPEVFYTTEGHRQNPGFDAVVSNPPYVSNWELTAYDSRLPAILEGMYQEVATGHWDLYVLFIYQALGLTTGQGAMSFIVPSPLAVEKYGIGIRKFLLKKCRLCTLVDFGEYRVFDDVSRQYLIFRAAPGYLEGNLTQVVTFRRGEFEKRTGIVQDEFARLPNFTLRTDLIPLDLSIRSKMIGHGIRLGCLCCVNPGVVAHSRKGSPIKFRKDDVIHSSRLDSGFKKYIEGRSMDRYEVIWEGLYMDYDSKRELFHRTKFPELFESPKIMMRGISGANNKIISCYDVDGYYTNHSVFHAITWTEEIARLQPPGSIEVYHQAEDFALAYIAAIVNSTLMSHYFSKFLATGTLQGSYSSVYPEDMRKFPIRRIEFTTPEEERRELVEDVVERYLAYLEHGEDVMVLAFVAARLEAEPEEADVVHDQLAYLAEQIIEMHKEKQAEAKGFLAWLADYTGLPIDEWKLKSRVQVYWEHPWSELQRALSQNRRSMERDVEGREAQEKIKREFEDSMGKLNPLLTHIEATDRLIDRIVYRLYGLTDEEIAVAVATDRSG